MKLVLGLLVIVQKVLLVASYQFYRCVTPERAKRSIDWVVGPDEVASVVAQLRGAVERSYSVLLSPHPLYEIEHDYRLIFGPRSSERIRGLRRILAGPVVLGRLMNRARGFLYVASSGYLRTADERDFEFRYLKKKGLKLGIYWAGSEIRSLPKMRALERETGLPNIATYHGLVVPYLATAEFEAVIERRARVAMAYADVMFDYPTAQLSYLTGHREPAFYLMPADRFSSDDDTFDDLSTIVVTHATTSPIIKGTQLVRAAVAALKAKGYEFDYVELIGVSNEELLAQLSRTHIALNHFYGFTMGVFGIEALAAQCAVLASSDGGIETNLPPGVDTAIVSTKHWQVYDNLKELLDHPERIRPIAEAGQAWARRYASVENTGRILQGILDSVLDGTYDPAARALLTREQLYELPEPDRVRSSA